MRRRIAPRAAPYDDLECGEQRRVELRAHVGAHERHRRVVRECLLVPALGCQCVIDIRDAEHARGKRDGLSCKAVRISAAIPSFVVAFDNGPHVPGELGVGKQLHTGGGMTPHECPLVHREFARLVQHGGGYEELAHIVQQRTNPEPEDRRVIIGAHPGPECAPEIGNANAVPLGVQILRFDRLTPLARDVQEVTLEEGGATVHVSELVACTQLRKEAMGLVQPLEHLPIPTLQVVQLGEFPCRFSLQDDVLSLAGTFFRDQEMLFRCEDVAGGARNDPIDVRSFAIGMGVSQFARNSRGVIARGTGFRQFALPDVQPGHVELREHALAEIPKRRTDFQRFTIRLAGKIESHDLGMQQPQVVERHHRFVREAGRSGVGKAGSMVQERLVMIAAHRCDHAEVRGGHGGQPRLTGTDGALACLQKETLCPVQVALVPLDGGEHVDGPATPRFVAGVLRYQQCKQRAGIGGGEIAVLQVRARDKPVQVRDVLRGRGRARTQRGVIERARLFALAHALQRLTLREDLDDPRALCVRLGHGVPRRRTCVPGIHFDRSASRAEDDHSRYGYQRPGDRRWQTPNRATQCQ